MIVEQGYHQPPPRPAVSRWRYAIIGAVAVLAAGVGVVLGSVLMTAGGAPLARAAAYVPADAVMYIEARLDLPGAQRDNLRGLLERFPAADADAILTDALADTLDAALATGGAPIDYSTDVAPWFDGTLAMAMLDYPLNMDPAAMRLPSMIGLFGVRDAAAASELTETLRAELAGQDATFTSSDHDGVTVWSLEVPESEFGLPIAGIGFAYAVTDDQLLLSNGVETIAAALDARAADSLADSDEARRLLDALPEERSGLAIVNSAAMMAELRSELGAAEPAMAEMLEAYLEAVPPLSVGSLSFGDDAFLMDAAAGLPDGDLRPQNSERLLAERLPADTLFFADGSRLGPAIEQMLVAMKASLAIGPMSEQQLDELEQIETALGAELEEFVSWIGDGALAAGWDGSAPWFGALLEADDADAAARRLNQLGALAELAAGEGGSGITVSTETVAGVEVTTVELTTMSFAAESMSFQYALDGELALLGVGNGFVEAALAQEAGASLAGSDRFTSALGRFGGEDNAGSFFVDLAGVVEAFEATLGTAEPGYAEIRENLLPLDFFAGVTRVDGDRAVSRLGLVLR
jgi:hypothetical protein